MYLRQAYYRSRGDTLIEVLLAVTVFSLVSVGAMTIMNQGTNVAQRALEITQVRYQVDAQAEAIRAAHQAHAANPSDNSTWSAITEDTHQPLEVGATSCPNTTSMRTRIALNPENATVLDQVNMMSMNEATSPVYASIRDNGGTRAYGIWIEVNRHEAAENDYGIADAYDFRIRACWYGAGTDTPQQLETDVRLYDI